jgi:hypothetical protein
MLRMMRETLLVGHATFGPACYMISKESGCGEIHASSVTRPRNAVEFGDTVRQHGSRESQPMAKSDDTRTKLA